MEYLLDRGAELTALLLHMAAAWGHKKLGYLLLKRGADPNLPPNFLVDWSVIKGPYWGLLKNPFMGSTVFEAARLNRRTNFLAFLENWCMIPFRVTAILYEQFHLRSNLR